MDTYGVGTLIGHEVKVSRADWLNELREPDKSDKWKQHCHQWYLVISDPSYVRKGELPDDWGLMIVDKTGNLRVTKSAPKTNPLPLNNSQIGSLMRSVAKTREKELR